MAKELSNPQRELPTVVEEYQGNTTLVKKMDVEGNGDLDKVPCNRKSVKTSNVLENVEYFKTRLDENSASA